MIDYLSRIEGELELPNLPDMLFAKNGLSLQHKKGFGIRFCPIEALKTVNATEDLVHVAMSKGQLISKCPFVIILSTKIPTIF